MESVVEDLASAWLLELLGLPADSAVGFVTGATMANFTGLAAGRHAVLDAEREEYLAYRAGFADEGAHA